MKYVVLINGPAGAGKDTFMILTRQVVELKYADYNATVRTLSAIDPVKDAARVLGWDGAKDPESRNMLADFKVLADKYLNATLDYLFDAIDHIGRPNPFRDVSARDSRPITALEKMRLRHRDVIFVCVRSDDDAKAIWEHYEHDPDVVVTGVYIHNDRIEAPAATNDADKNALKRNYVLYPGLILNNGSYGDLMNAAEDFLEKLFTKKEPLDS